MDIVLIILQKTRYFLLVTTVFCYVISLLSLKRHLSLPLMLLTLFRLGGGFSTPPPSCGKIVITPTPKEL